MANSIGWGSIYSVTNWGKGVINNISWGKVYANLAGAIPSFALDFTKIATDFTFTRNSFTTRVNENGLIETVGNNVPRIDYSSGEGAFLLEPASTNLYLNSETLSTQDVTTSASTYTVSFRGTGSVSLSGSGSGTLVGTGAMDLVSLTFTATAGTLTSTVSGSVKYSNLENLGYATSWIPTDGTIATRAAELCVDATPTINSEEGVFYAETSALVNGGANRYVSISDGTTDNRLQLIYSNTASRLSVGGKNNGVSLTTINDTSFDQAVNHKIAVVYSALGVKLFVDGIEKDSNTDNASFPIGGLTDLDFSLWNSSSSPFYGNTKDLKIYTEALTDGELVTLTTI